MRSIVFFDLEVDPEDGRIRDFGAVRGKGGGLHTASRNAFAAYVSGCHYICGHNILAHDLNYAGGLFPGSCLPIDTLCLSPLLFPARPHHALLKDDKLQTDQLNNPLNDSMKARELFYDEVSAFLALPGELREIFCELLWGSRSFHGFFHYLGMTPRGGLEAAIRRVFGGKICHRADLGLLIRKSPVELAYTLALIRTGDETSVTPGWVMRSYPRMDNVIKLLRATPCQEGCAYCRRKLDVRLRLKEMFGFDSFRTYDGEPLQERAAQAAVRGKSLLAVFPTGGGKSVTFQLPALIAGETARGLTVVISPLQSLMKDQVDNLAQKGIADAVAINGLLSPIERAEAIRRVESGLASILYLSPEALRSRTIERLLLSRNIVRFVIDEAHCFSAWGQDFRVDYLYIGDFIRGLKEKKRINHDIAVSCFTATAKQKVISDIREYFKAKLNLDLELYTTGAARTNLRYAVLHMENDEDKYIRLRSLIQGRRCPVIVYVSRTKRTRELAARLAADGLTALPFNGRMESSEKIANQEAFIRGEVQVIVATSAFGMGVDKRDVGLVVHYDISDSLENYVQEAGRAGRDQSLKAECYVLFNDDDLDKHFILLNQTKLSISEIQQVWKAIKDLTRDRPSICRSPLEIARQAGWDDSSRDLETRVKTAIAALETAGYVARGKNSPQIYATSIRVHSMQEAAAIIDGSGRFDEAQRLNAKRIIKSLISSRSIAKAGNDEAESRVDYLADMLGLPKEEVISAINLMREEKILADAVDLTAYLHGGRGRSKAGQVLGRFAALEAHLNRSLKEEWQFLNYREVNDEAVRAGIASATVKDIRTILYYWTIRGYIRKTAAGDGEQSRVRRTMDAEAFQAHLDRRIELSDFILRRLYEKSREAPGNRLDSDPVQFSLLELQEAYNAAAVLRTGGDQATGDDVQHALLYLSKIGALELEGGFTVFYGGISLRRLIADNRIKYKKDDYQQLSEYYQQKIQQIHIVGEYAHMMVRDYDDALGFVNDYFQLDYQLFLRKYFRGNRHKEINRNITPEKFDRLFGPLSPVQRQILDDSESKYIVVAAGPGSGKTMVLTHKLASLITLEDVKHEQLLMLTFSRAAASEFKRRLLELSGNAAHYVKITTFHGYSFELLGRVGSLEDSDNVVAAAARLIQKGEADNGIVTKTVLVIDEAQDMSENEFALVRALMERNEEMRVIAVGDDDQNIFEFRGSSSAYMKRLMEEYAASRYEMTDNYRSKRAIVEWSGAFAGTISGRMKTTGLTAVSREEGLVSVTRHSSGHLEHAVAEQVAQTRGEGSACVLTATNDAALRIVGLLLKRGIKARLIQSNEDFSLLKLAEIRYFLDALGAKREPPTISEAAWDRARHALEAAWGDSQCLPACLRIIDSFAQLNATRFWSDLMDFLWESRLEHFEENGQNAVLVSTMHKAKGREFDSVYLMLDGSVKTDADRRTVYVAMTRAKNALYIHCSTGLFDRFSGLASRWQEDKTPYPQPEEIILSLGHKDVALGFFKGRGKSILRLRSGQALTFQEDFLWADLAGQRVKAAKLSQGCRKKLEDLRAKGYEVLGGEIRFIVYWKDEDGGEHPVILPDLFLKKH